MSMDTAVVTTSLATLSLSSMLKVVHSVIDSLNRRRAPSRDILVQVDGSDEADRVVEVADRLVRRIEADEGRSLSELSADSIRRYADMLLATANVQARRQLPVVDDSRTRALVAEMRKVAG